MADDGRERERADKARERVGRPERDEEDAVLPEGRGAPERTSWGGQAPFDRGFRCGKPLLDAARGARLHNMARSRSHRPTLLERIVEQRTGEALVASVGVAVEKVAEEIAREALTDETFRRTIRELVQRRSRELLDELLGNGKAQKR